MALFTHLALRRVYTRRPSCPLYAIIMKNNQKQKLINKAKQAENELTESYVQRDCKVCKQHFEVAPNAVTIAAAKNKVSKDQCYLNCKPCRTMIRQVGVKATREARAPKVEPNTPPPAEGVKTASSPKSTDKLTQVKVSNTWDNRHSIAPPQRSTPGLPEEPEEDPSVGVDRPGQLLQTDGLLEVRAPVTVEDTGDEPRPANPKVDPIELLPPKDHQGGNAINEVVFDDTHHVYLDDTSFPDELKTTFETTLWDIIMEKAYDLTRNKKEKHGLIFNKTIGKFLHSFREWRLRNSNVINTLKKWYRVRRDYYYRVQYSTTPGKDTRPAYQNLVEIRSATKLMDVRVRDTLVLRTEGVDLERILREHAQSRSSKYMKFFEWINTHYLRSLPPISVELESFQVDAAACLDLNIIDGYMSPQIMYTKITAGLESAIININKVDNFKASAHTKTVGFLMSRYYFERQHLKLLPTAVYINTDHKPKGVFHLGVDWGVDPNPPECQNIFMDTPSVTPRSPRPYAVSPSLLDKHWSLHDSEEHATSLTTPMTTVSVNAIVPWRRTLSQTSERRRLWSIATKFLAKWRGRKSGTKTEPPRTKSRDAVSADLSIGTSEDSVSIHSPQIVMRHLRLGSSGLTTPRSESNNYAMPLIASLLTRLASGTGSLSFHPLLRMNNIRHTNSTEGLIRAVMRSRLRSVHTSNSLRSRYLSTQPTSRRSQSVTDHNTLQICLQGALISIRPTTHRTRGFLPPN